MCKRCLIVLWILYLALLAGCDSSNRAISGGESVRPGVLKEANFAGRVELGRIEVRYQNDLESQADYVAVQIDKILSHVQNSTGFGMSFDKVVVYLLWGDSREHLRTKTIFSESDEQLQLILFVKHGGEPCDSIVARNYHYPYVFIHEVVEVSMGCPKEGAAVSIDRRWNKICSFINYNRWFREGFSSYAGYLAYESVVSDADFNQKCASSIFIHNGMHLNPFSALNKVGSDLFQWHQFTEYDADWSPGPGSEKMVIDYYDASLGLFLVIRNRFGEEAIHEIFDGIKTLRKADGAALIKLANEILDSDIEELVENFYFPETGLHMESVLAGLSRAGVKITKEGLLVGVVESDSYAWRAGIRKGDVIYKVDGEEVMTNLDFELRIFELMQKQSVGVDFWRQGESMAVEMQLAN